MSLLSFRRSKSFYSLAVLFKGTNDFGSAFPNPSDRTLCKDQTQDTPQLSVFHFLFVVSLQLSFDAETLPFTRACSHVIMLPVCSSRNVEGNFTLKMNYRYCCHFPGLEFMQLLERVGGLPSKGRGDGWILKTAYFLENYTGTGNWKCRYMRGICMSY